MEIKLIAMDLDGTLLDSRSAVTPETRRAIGLAREAGIVTAAATGRPLSALPDFILDGSLIDFAITSNGSSIFALPDRERIYVRKMPGDTVRSLLEAARGLKATVEVYIDGFAYCAEDYYRKPTDFNLPERMDSYVPATRRPVSGMQDFLEQNIDSIEGLTFITADHALRELIRERVRAVPGIYTTSSAPYYIETANGEVSKANALRHLCSRLGISAEHTATFGDGINDIEMIIYAGTGVAMANSAPELISAADLVTASNDDDGIARFIYSTLAPSPISAI
ncbi:MAG: Cof-type HAD-IIB family hydrolase [Lachnospiraceae bacterium]|nr:Cof-type HAD-IIB family hydrolase [Lachnospiraceae bacterium]